jgi:hypothetical protein
VSINGGNIRSKDIFPHKLLVAEVKQSGTCVTHNRIRITKANRTNRPSGSSCRRIAGSTKSTNNSSIVDFANPKIAMIRNIHNIRDGINPTKRRTNGCTGSRTIITTVTLGGESSNVFHKDIRVNSGQFDPRMRDFRGNIKCE